jgi:hypothetical protein
MSARVEFVVQIAEDNGSKTTLLYRADELADARWLAKVNTDAGVEAHLCRLTTVETKTEMEI